MEKFRQRARAAIYSGLYYSGIVHLYMKCVFLGKKEYPLLVLNFHSFVENYDNCLTPEPAVYMPIDRTGKLLQFCARYFHFTSLDSAVEQLRTGTPFTEPTLVLTTDDGFADNYELLFPELKARGIPATMFITTGLIGTLDKLWLERLHEATIQTSVTVASLKINNKVTNFELGSIEQKRASYVTLKELLKDCPAEVREQHLADFEKQLNYTVPLSPVMLSWEQVTEMHQQGISFGAHTMTHPILSRLPVNDAKKEILDSKNLIEEKLQTKVRHFAFPNGAAKDFSEELQTYCKTIGLDSISSAEWGNNKVADDRWNLKRIPPCLPISEFAIYMVRAFLR